MTRHTSPNIVQELKYDWQKCRGKNESWSSPISFKSFASLWFLLYPLCRKVICNHQNSTKVMSDICVFFRRFKGFSVFDFSVYDIITLVHVLWWLEAYDPFFQNWHFALNGLSSAAELSDDYYEPSLRRSSSELLAWVGNWIQKLHHDHYLFSCLYHKYVFMAFSAQGILLRANQFLPITQQ